MAQTEIAQFKIPLYKATKSRVPVVLGDTVELVLYTDKEAEYATKNVVLTYVNHLTHEYGWDRDLVDLRSMDVKRPHDKHVPACS